MCLGCGPLMQTTNMNKIYHAIHDTSSCCHSLMTYNTKEGSASNRTLPNSRIRNKGNLVIMNCITYLSWSDKSMLVHPDVFDMCDSGIQNGSHLKQELVFKFCLNRMLSHSMLMFLPKCRDYTNIALKFQQKVYYSKYRWPRCRMYLQDCLSSG